MSPHEARLSKGLTLADMTRATGFSGSYISCAERGKGPASLRLREALAPILGEVEWPRLPISSLGSQNPMGKAGRYLRDRMREDALGQDEVARRIGFTSSSVSVMICKKVSFHKLVDLERAIPSFNAEACALLMVADLREGA